MKETSTAIVIASLEKKAKPLITSLSRIEAIESQEDYDSSSIIISKLKALKKEASAEESTMLDPLKKTEKAIRSHFQPFYNKVSEMESAIKSLMLEWVNKQDLIAAKAEKDFEDGKIASVGTYAKKVAQAQVKNGTAQRKKVWYLEIEEPSSIPREYLVPDTSKIEEALKSGKKVKGCKLVQKNVIAIR